MLKNIIVFFSVVIVLYCNALSQTVTQSVQDEDPRARAEYEFNRLRDPKTGKIPYDIREKELSFSKTIPTIESLYRLGLGKGQGAKSLQALTWSQRGPVNVGGRTRALGIDVTNENIILAGGVSGGMWRSSDGGTSWTLVSGLSNLHSITCIAQDTRAGHTNTWYYGTGELDGNSATGGSGPYRGDGYYKSTDNGLSWTKLTSTSTGTPQKFDSGFDYTWNIAIDPSNTSEDVVYAATFGAISRSSDGGNSWTTVLGDFSITENNNTPYSRYSDVVVTSTGIVYAALSQANQDGTSSASAGVWRSTDGINWTNISNGFFSLIFKRTVIAVAPSNENVVYIVSETPGSGFQTAYGGVSEDHSFCKYTYLTGDGSGVGGVWEDRSLNLPSFGQPVGEFASQGGYDLVIKVKPDDENVVFLGGTDLFRSADGFVTNTNTTWIGGYATVNNVSEYPNHHPDQHAIVFSPTSPTTMWSGNDGGIQKTTNNLAPSVSWIWLNNGYNTSQFYSIAIDHATFGNDVIIGGTQDNGTWFTNTTNAAIPWVKPRGGDGTFCAIANGRTSYYISVQGGNIYRFILNASGGITAFTRVDPYGGAGYLFVDPFILDPNNTKRMYFAGGTRIWRNDDLTGIPLSSGSTTTVNWINMTNTVVAGTTVTALDVSTTPANRLYYGRNNGHVYRIDNANVGNPSQTDVSAVNFPAGGYVSSISVDPLNADNVMVAFSNYLVLSLFYTSNGGTSWTQVAGNLEQFPDGTGNGPSVRWAKIIPGAYYVGTSTGLYSTSTLNGASTVWAQEGSSTIGNVVIDMIDFRSVDGRIVVATHGNGIFSSLAIISTPVAPTLLFPGDRATNQLTSLPMTWASVYTSTGYELQVATDSLMGSVVYDDSTIINDTAKTTGPFINFTTHFWRVRAKNSLGWGTWSAIHRFTTGFTEVPTTFMTGWNLVSIPVSLLDYRKNTIFPTSISEVYAYESGSYTTKDTLENKVGYWVKFPAGGPFSYSGILRTNDTIDVAEGWNLIGSISDPISQSAVESDPPGIIASNFFQYNHAYAIADTIVPLQGHWVKTSSAGKIILSSVGLAKQSTRVNIQSSLGIFNSIQLVDAVGNIQKLYYGIDPPDGISLSQYEFPPVTPEGVFDIRFASNRMLELSDGKSTRGYQIKISSLSYPVKINWQANRQPFDAYLKIGSRLLPLRQFGSFELRNAEERIALQLGKEIQIPKEYSLEQNYPNPFNPTTTISFSIPQKSFVSLKVFDVLGREVATLANEIQQAGNKSVEFNGEHQPSGVYFYRLQAGTFTETKKLILLK
jgi:hypothetical protein